MPQLNPSPWFSIMLLTWIILMFIFMTKTTMMLYPNSPTELTSNKTHQEAWTWPWH